MNPIPGAHLEFILKPGKREESVTRSILFPPTGRESGLDSGQPYCESVTCHLSPYLSETPAISHHPQQFPTATPHATHSSQHSRLKKANTPTFPYGLHQTHGRTGSSIATPTHASTSVSDTNSTHTSLSLATRPMALSFHQLEAIASETEHSQWRYDKENIMMDFGLDDYGPSSPDAGDDDNGGFPQSPVVDSTDGNTVFDDDLLPFTPTPGAVAQAIPMVSLDFAVHADPAGVLGRQVEIASGYASSRPDDAVANEGAAEAHQDMEIFSSPATSQPEAAAWPTALATPGPCAPSERPRSGKGSRTRTEEVPRDELDEVIFNLFPIKVLWYNGPKFKDWQRTNPMRKLTKEERTRLTEIRRRFSARQQQHRVRIAQKEKLERAERAEALCLTLHSTVNELQAELAHVKAELAASRKREAERRAARSST
jgi:hypothetical protein